MHDAMNIFDSKGKYYACGECMRQHVIFKTNVREWLHIHLEEQHLEELA